MLLEHFCPCQRVKNTAKTTNRADLSEMQFQTEREDDKDSESVTVCYHLAGDSRKGKCYLVVT